MHDFCCPTLAVEDGVDSVRGHTAVAVARRNRNLTPWETSLVYTKQQLMRYAAKAGLFEAGLNKFCKELHGLGDHNYCITVSAVNGARYKSSTKGHIIEQHMVA